MLQKKGGRMRINAACQCHKSQPLKPKRETRSPFLLQEFSEGKVSCEQQVPRKGHGGGRGLSCSDFCWGTQASTCCGHKGAALPHVALLRACIFETKQRRLAAGEARLSPAGRRPPRSLPCLSLVPAPHPPCAHQNGEAGPRKRLRDI